MTTDELLNLAARVFLRAFRPLTAHAVLMKLGRGLPQRTSREDVRRAASALAGQGTCLSRALAIAATAPGADVVIGVRPEGEAQILAHAWLEVDGEPLDQADPVGQEIARLPGRGTRSPLSPAPE
jgi:hypothetical protein